MLALSFNVLALLLNVLALSINVPPLSKNVLALSINVLPLSQKVPALSINVLALSLIVLPLTIHVLTLWLIVPPLSINVLPLSVNVLSLSNDLRCRCWCLVPALRNRLSLAIKYAAVTNNTRMANAGANIFCIPQTKCYFRQVHFDYYPQFFTATILEWKPLLRNDAYKKIIVDSMQFWVADKRVVIFSFISSALVLLVTRCRANTKHQQRQKKQSSLFWIAFITSVSTYCSAQNWTNVGNGFDSYPNRFFVDTGANTLYAMGNFNYSGGVYVPGAARFHGTYWDSIPVIMDYPNYQNIYSYKNKIIFGTYSIYTWDGNQVDTLAKFYNNQGVYGFTTFNDDLIAWGSFDSINGIAANDIAKWDGVTWSAIDTTHWSDPIVVAKEYKGELYIGGNMYNYGGVSRDLSRWNGTQWLPVGNGIQGGFASVGSFEIYNDDLYIGGGFTTAQGNPGNSIARWDGTQWKDVGIDMTNLNAGVRDLQVFNNELYACGSFNKMGNLNIQGIAKWNGTKWCGLGFDSYTVMAMAVYNDELYIGGPFTSINSIPLNHVAKWIGGNYTDTCSEATGMDEIDREDLELSVYPNPASCQLMVTSVANLRNSTATISTTTGAVVLQATLVNPDKNEIDVSKLAAGLYFLSLQDEKGRVVRRFVKSN